MTQEDKELLFKDLSARLPYGVMVADFENNHRIGLPAPLTNLAIDESYYVGLKLYLRPMSSMTAEESKEYYMTFWYRDESAIGNNGEGRITLHSFDWLNEHHFDYRGLIEKGLALEAPEGMYNKEDKQ